MVPFVKAQKVKAQKGVFVWRAPGACLVRYFCIKTAVVISGVMWPFQFQL